MTEWPLPIAKNKLGELVELAFREGPQTITLHGKRKVVLISADEYDALVQRRPKESLIEFLRTSPLTEVELDLERSRDACREISSCCTRD
ncbi:type II toxin-antitoxin system Phd/YefM family antitoxin [Pistricoccus aurantiacus]|uniref:type II toxin-antitoxin system Phd/YefM family antitoxin n=1 Tax=Pistricoccus aurantiacus TaxID=1883414 RepID=UPI0036380A6E